MHSRSKSTKWNDSLLAFFKQTKNGSSKFKIWFLLYQSHRMNDEWNCKECTLFAIHIEYMYWINWNVTVCKLYQWKTDSLLFAFDLSFYFVFFILFSFRDVIVVLALFQPLALPECTMCTRSLYRLFSCRHGTFEMWY